MPGWVGRGVRGEGGRGELEGSWRGVGGEFEGSSRGVGWEGGSWRGVGGRELEEEGLEGRVGEGRK